MRTLRAQVTALLVVAMVVILAFANTASFFLMAPSGPPPHMFDELAERAAFTAELASALPNLTSAGSATMGIRSTPPEGRTWDRATRDLQEALDRLGKPYPVRVVERAGEGWPLAGVQLPDGRWLVMALSGPGLPPGPPGGPGGPSRPNWTLNLATWLGFIVAGITLVVVFVVRRLLKPLSLIEEAASRIGPGGEAPILPEEGPEEVRAAAAAINRLSARLKGAMDSRMRIVAAAAHDLRTPLTRMRLRAEFIPDDEDRTQWLSDLAELDRIADSAIRLVREEVESGPDEAVRLDALARGVCAEVTDMGRSARLVEAVAASVSGRPLSLKRAVRNLIVNAATHGGGARVAVRREGTKVVLVIEDDGPGIPEALMGQVFEPFFRVDPARQTKIPGAGLGLAIANEIFTRQGGHLTLANRPGGGLLQRVELPAAPMEPKAAG